MALDQLNLDNLENVKSKLQAAIARDPGHSQMEKVELEDVKQWIELRRREQLTAEPKF